MNSIRLSLLILLLICGTHLHAQETSIDLRKDGRIITAERNTFFRQCLTSPAAQTKPCKCLQALSQDPRDKLAAIDLVALVVPEGKTGEKYLVGLVIGSSTLPQDFPVNENDFKILRDYATKKALAKIDEKYREIRQADGDSAKVKIETTELRAVIAESREDSEQSSLYAGFLLAREAKASDSAPYADLVTKYRKEAEKSLDPFVSLMIKQNKLPSVTPFRFGAADDFFAVSDLQGYPVDESSPGYLKVWRGRSLVVIAEKPGASFDPSKYKGGLVEYLIKENSSLTGGFTVPAMLFDRPTALQGVASAIAALDAQVERTPELFSAPSPRLQTELLGNQTNETAKEAISTLAEHQRELPETTLERAALLAFALEDYRRAAEFVDTGLKVSPGNKQLLAARGLIQYQQSLYPQALTSLRQAAPSVAAANPNFRAALMSNEGLVQWGLGQTGNAETSLNNSIPLFRGDDAKQQQAYLLLTQADFYVDYGQPAKALKMSEEALKLFGAPESNRQARIVEGRTHRLRAKVALFRGIINEANDEIAKAIKLHLSESSFLELAQSKDVQADIKELTGMHAQALKTLEEAAALYKDSNYIKGQAENQWKRANVLLALNRFDEAKKLIEDASSGFTQINYRRGLGDCEVLRGLLILRRANHQYLMRFNANMSPQEKQTIDKEFLSQTRLGVARFETAIKTYQEIGYKRGLAYAQDKLAINIVTLSEQPSEEDFSRAEFISKEAARIFEEISDKRGQAVVYGNLGLIYRRNKQYELGQSNLERSLEISRRIEFKLGIGRQLFNLGRLHYEKGFGKSEEDLLKAKDYFLEAQKVFKQTQAGEDELKAIDEYLKHISEILR